MPNNKPLTKTQLDDAARLRALWDAFHKRTGMTQKEAGAGFDPPATAGALNQMMAGRTALNLNRLFDFVHLFRCRLSDISPTLSRKVYRWVDEAENFSYIAIEECINADDLARLSALDVRAIEAMIKHLLSVKMENPAPGRRTFRPRLVKP